MADENKSGKKDGALGDLVKAESMVQLAIMLPAACLIGWGGGTLLDKLFHTHWIMFVGIAVGAVAGFVQMYTTASRYLNRSGH